MQCSARDMCYTELHLFQVATDFYLHAVFIIPTHILVCILFAPPSLFFIMITHFITASKAERFCMTVCMCTLYVHTAI